MIDSSILSCMDAVAAEFLRRCILAFESDTPLSEEEESMMLQIVLDYSLDENERDSAYEVFDLIDPLQAAVEKYARPRVLH